VESLTNLPRSAAWGGISGHITRVGVTEAVRRRSSRAARQSVQLTMKLGVSAVRIADLLKHVTSG
jgi:hypothetical protein